MVIHLPAQLDDAVLNTERLTPKEIVALPFARVRLRDLSIGPSLSASG